MALTSGEQIDHTLARINATGFYRILASLGVVATVPCATLVVRPNRSATMVVELDGATVDRLFAEREVDILDASPSFSSDSQGAAKRHRRGRQAGRGLRLLPDSD